LGIALLLGQHPYEDAKLGLSPLCILHLAPRGVVLTRIFVQWIGKVYVKQVLARFPHYCTPWEPHEKGGVENGVGYVRERMFVPLPKVKSYEELNRVLRKRCERENNRKVRGESQQRGELWEEERQRLRPVPQRSYEHAEIREARVTPDSQVVFETNRYSLPVKRGREQGSGEGVSFSDRNCGRDEGVGTP
jgi:hypothetical protein